MKKDRKILKVELFYSLTLMLLFILVSTTYSQNLLINPDAETGTTEGWVDPDDAWGTSAEITPQEGSYFFWPSRIGIANTQMYQDVDVSTYNLNSYFVLSGWLANWDQAPHDRATLAITAYDINGNQLLYADREHRNPVWGYYEISAKIPATTKTLRVLLIATRFVGYDNDAYFDNLSLEIRDTLPDIQVQVTSANNQSDILLGNTLQLTAITNGGTDNSYSWSSSYDEIASVDSNGLVTAKKSGTFTIQAIGNFTNAIGTIKLLAHPENYIKFIYPEGEEIFESGKNVNINWEVIGNVASSTLSWSANDGTDWEDISTIENNSTEYIWTVPQTDSALNRCLLKMDWGDDASITQRFSILPEGSPNDVIKSDVSVIPSQFELSQNYPNPFNPTTKIKYSIPNIGASLTESVRLTVYDVLGNEIRTLVNKIQQPGSYEVRFDASGLPSGIYFYLLKAGNYIETKKMILMK